MGLAQRQPAAAAALAPRAAALAADGAAGSFQRAALLEFLLALFRQATSPPPFQLLALPMSLLYIPLPRRDPRSNLMG